MMSFAVVTILKATFVCGAALASARVCRRARASIRHLMFALAFAALIAIPLAAPLVPTVTVRLPAAASSLAERRSAAELPAQPSVDLRPVSDSSPAIARAAANGWRPTMPQILLVLWLIGVAVFLLPVFAGFWQVRRLRRSAIPWIDGQHMMHSLASAHGVRRPFDVVLHDAVAGPLTCGVVRPLIILPVASRDWDEASLRRSLMHELEHVARWDLLTNCVSRMICAAYWFHPLVWSAWRRLRLEAEKACDDTVVLEDDARDYALLLVAMAQPAADGQSPWLAMAGRDDLAVRVAALLDERQTRGRIGRRRAAALTVAGVIAMIAVASITVARAMPQAEVTPAPSAPAFADASIKRNPLEQIRMVNGQMIATNVTARALLLHAFGGRDIDGGPWWLNGYRFDIVANMPMDYRGPGQGSAAMQAFLAERFKLRAHLGTRDFPVYALVLARADRRLGPQISPSQMDCSQRDSVRARAVSGVVLATDAGAPPNCSTSSSDGRLAGRGVTLEEFARNLLSTHLRFYGAWRPFDRQLIDRTGLSGRFDFHMEWEQDVAAGSAAPSDLESKAPRFLAALRQQLGLTIESQMAPAPVLVIDSIEEPSEK